MNWDTIIIGAGQTGVPLSTRLARAGQEVLLVERQHVGGTCVNYGCTPTKTLVASARAAQVARTAGRLGIHASDVTVDFDAVMARKRTLVEQWRSGVERTLREAGDRLTVLHGHARFAGSRSIEVAGESHTADRIVINTGARAAEPSVEGLAAIPWLDNVRLLDLEELPQHLLIVGGGFIGCEFAQLFRRFGADVTLVEPGQHLLGREDPDVSAAIEEVFREEGIRLLLSDRANSVAGSAAGVKVTMNSGKRVHATHLLVATGRTPNTADLGCDAAGVKLDEQGYVVVDEQYRTSADDVFATGDVTGPPQFTHAAWDDHRLLFDVMANGASPKRSARLVPHVTYTDPQVAGVGLTEREATERGVAYELAAMPFGHIARAMETDERAGVVRILVDPRDEKIIGATIVGAEAGELIHIVHALMLVGASARVLVEGQVAHPAFAEGLQSALMRLDRFSP